MKKDHKKLPTRIKINIAIFALLAILFGLMPRMLFGIRFPFQVDEPDYAGNFAYVLHDICPCHEGEDECAGYYACGQDKANITYNLDNAPADKLEEAKRDAYFEGRIEATRQSAMIQRYYLISDLCYLLSFLSLVAGIIYWNHSIASL